MDGPNYNDDLDNDFISEEWQFVSDADRAEEDDDDLEETSPGVNFFIDDDDDGEDSEYEIWETDEDGEFII